MADSNLVQRICHWLRMIIYTPKFITEKIIMEKTIKIDGREVKFKATAATIRLYRQHTGRDLLVDMQTLQKSTGSGDGLSAEALTLFENIAYTMAKQADDSIPDSADEWLDEFEMFSIYVVLPQIVELWRLNELTTSESKKKVKA